MIPNMNPILEESHILISFEYPLHVSSLCPKDGVFPKQRTISIVKSTEPDLVQRVDNSGVHGLTLKISFSMLLSSSSICLKPGAFLKQKR